MADPTAPVDDIEIIRMTAAEWDTALAASLADLGLTWEQLAAQARYGEFESLEARKLWLMAGHRGFGVTAPVPVSVESDGNDGFRFEQRPTAPVTAEDLRDRYAEAATEWALMYPLARFLGLVDGDAVKALAMSWGQDLADAVLPVRDAELKRLRGELAKEAKRLQYAQGRLRDADTVKRGLRAALDSVEAERDALKTAVEQARAEAERWRDDLKANERESWAVTARHVCAMILAALAVPESHEDAPTEETDERR
jgi:hypothetical protein